MTGRAFSVAAGRCSIPSLAIHLMPERLACQRPADVVDDDARRGEHFARGCGNDDAIGFARDRARQWGGWERTKWNANPAPFGDPLQGLMRFAGTLPDLDRRATIWDVPTSMRNVDAECRLEISQAYLFEDTAAEEPA